MTKPKIKGETPQINVEKFLKMAKQGKKEMAEKAAAEQAAMGASLHPQPAAAPGGPQAAAQNQIPLPLKPFLDKLDVIIAKLEVQSVGMQAIVDQLHTHQATVTGILNQLEHLNSRFEA
jgi:hypothetical protein